MKTLTFKLAVGLSAFALSACSGSEPAPTETELLEDDAMTTDTLNTTEATGGQNIVALAQGSAQVSTLVSAITAAGLGETLSGAGPFTVFAPSNDAFAKLDKATLDGLLKPESKDKLAALLKYHVVSGDVKSSDLAKLITDGKGIATIMTVNGGSLKASMDGNKIVLTDAKGGKSIVTAPDMVASNGTIHLVDTVVMP